MVINNKTISEQTVKEQYFYPDRAEICWQYVIFMVIMASLGMLLFITMHANGGNGILFLLFFATLAYILYISYFIWHAPKLYIDDAHTYIRFKNSVKNEIVNIKDIQYYDYFSCYKNPLKYPFLCLCVQLVLTNGKRVEFFAFMRGAQMVIERKMSLLGISKKS